jgi:hypothetical protein
MDAGTPLHEYRVDFLVAVELRTWFMKEIGANVAVVDITGETSARNLA